MERSIDDVINEFAQTKNKEEKYSLLYNEIYNYAAENQDNCKALFNKIKEDKEYPTYQKWCITEILADIQTSIQTTIRLGNL